MKFSILSVLLFLSSSFIAQVKVYPFTGIVTKQNGIFVEKFQAYLDQATWYNNKLPIGSQFKFELEEFRGFSAENGMYYPGCEVFISTMNGDTLGYSSNMYPKDGFEVSESNSFSKLNIKLSITKGVDYNQLINTRVRFFDAREQAVFTNQRHFEIEMKMLFVEDKQELNSDNFISHFKSFQGYSISTLNLTPKDAKFVSEIQIEKNQKIHTLTIDRIEGIPSDALKESQSFVQIYSKKGELLVENCLFEETLKQSKVQIGFYDLTVKIPVEINDKYKNAIIRYHWQSSDKSMIDSIYQIP